LGLKDTSTNLTHKNHSAPLRTYLDPLAGESSEGW
jgi:hypothetical protein